MILVIWHKITTLGSVQLVTGVPLEARRTFLEPPQTLALLSWVKPKVLQGGGQRSPRDTLAHTCVHTCTHRTEDWNMRGKGL